MLSQKEKIVDKVLESVEKTKKKIIFLDVDGVMNSQLMYEKNLNHEQQIDEIDGNCIKNLNYIIENTNAEIVITSTWRYNKTKQQLQDIFKKHGFIGKIVDTTPILDKEFTVRGNEINQWIKNNEEYLGKCYYDFENYVILDDDSDMLYCQRENFIKVDSYSGLTHDNACKAIWILDKQKKH